MSVTEGTDFDNVTFTVPEKSATFANYTSTFLPTSTAPTLTINEVVRKVESIMFPIVFVCAATLNICVILGLLKNKLHISTKMLMVYQACNSIIGLGANGIYYPLVINNLGYPETVPSIWHNLPGAVTLGAIYSGMAVLLLIALQRVAFLYLPIWSREGLNVQNTLSGILACALFGMAWGVHSLFNCCRFEYSLSLGKWLYSAEMAQIQGKAVLVTMAVFPIATSLCYIAAGVKLILIKRKNRIHEIAMDVHTEAMSNQPVSTVAHSGPQSKSITQAQHRREAARERKVLAQFAIISAVWCIYSTMFNIIQQIPSVSNNCRSLGDHLNKRQKLVNNNNYEKQQYYRPFFLISIQTIETAINKMKQLNFKF